MLRVGAVLAVLWAVAGAVVLSEVMAITEDNAQLLQESELLFVAYTIAGCGHCRALAPVWEELAAKFRSEVPPVVARVDCDAHRSSLCADVHSFPTLRTVRRGVVKGYHGKRDLASLSLFLEKQTGPAVRRVPETAASFIAKDTAVVVASPGCDAAQLEAVSERLERRFFFVVEEQASDAECRIEMVRLHGAEREVWNGETPLDEFVEQEAQPLVSVFDKFAHLQSRRPVVYLFHKGPTPGRETMTIFRRLAASMRSTQLLFCTVHTEVWDGARMGVGKDYPTIAIGDTSKLNHHYAFPGHYQSRAMLDWLQSYVDGKLERTRVSLPLPNEADEANATVKTVVGDNFDAVVMDASKDVLVYFRNDQCGSSRNTDPIWQEFVDLVSTTRPQADHLVLAVADGWANDWEDWVNVMGLPDIRLFPADAKHQSKRFHGDRTAERILHWLEDFAYHPLQATDKSEL